MKRLLLLRHAKSLYAESGQIDRDRSLSQRGFHDAMAMAHEFADPTRQPDRVLCSAARRTRETLATILPRLERNCEITVTEDLYDYRGQTYADAIHALAGDAERLLVVGHNPTIHATAATLTGAGPDDERVLLAAKYPTGALAIIDFDIAEWTELGPGTGRLVDFLRPRDLTAD